MNLDVVCSGWKIAEAHSCHSDWWIAVGSVNTLFLVPLLFRIWESVGKAKKTAPKTYAEKHWKDKDVNVIGEHVFPVASDASWEREEDWSNGRRGELAFSYGRKNSTTVKIRANGNIVVSQPGQNQVPVPVDARKASALYMAIEKANDDRERKSRDAKANELLAATLSAAMNDKGA